MKALLLNGFERPEETGKYEKKLIEGLNLYGFEVESVKLCDCRLQSCLGCFGCWFITPGECLHSDQSREIIKKITQAKLLVLFSPIVFGGYSSCLKKIVEKFLQLVLPYIVFTPGLTYHRNRYGKAPDLLSVGVSDGGNNNEASIFNHLLQRNAVNINSQKSGCLVVDPAQGLDNFFELLSHDLEMKQYGRKN